MPFFTIQSNGRRLSAVEAGDLYALSLLKGVAPNPADALSALKRDPGHQAKTNTPGVELAFINPRDAAAFKAKVANMPHLAARLQ